MLEIKPIESKEEQKKILSLCHIPFKESYFAYKAYDGPSLLAAAQFDIHGSMAELDAIRQAEGTAEDFEGMFILGRAVLNFLDLCGVEAAFSSTTNEDERRLLKCVGFREDKDGVLRITLTGLFDAKCPSHTGCSQ